MAGKDEKEGERVGREERGAEEEEGVGKKTRDSITQIKKQAELLSQIKNHVKLPSPIK
jgi:hypothetical protein